MLAGRTPLQAGTPPSNPRRPGGQSHQRGGDASPRLAGALKSSQPFPGEEHDIQRSDSLWQHTGYRTVPQRFEADATTMSAPVIPLALSISKTDSARSHRPGDDRFRSRGRRWWRRDRSRTDPGTGQNRPTADGIRPRPHHRPRNREMIRLRLIRSMRLAGAGGARPTAHRSGPTGSAAHGRGTSSPATRPMRLWPGRRIGRSSALSWLARHGCRTPRGRREPPPGAAPTTP
jgi:hypothetical protein